MALSIRNLIFFLLTVSASLCTSLFAVPEEASGREFTVLPGGIKDWTGISYQRSDTLITPLNFNYQNRSQPINAKSTELIFCREKFDAATQRMLKIPVARTIYPNGTKNALLVFIPRTAPQADGLEFDILAVDDAPKTFPPDSLRVLNLTSATLTGRLGSKTVSLPPGISASVLLADIQLADGGIPFGIAARTANGEMALLHLSPLELFPRSRFLALIIPPSDPGSQAVKVSIITQVLPATTASVAQSSH